MNVTNILLGCINVAVCVYQIRHITFIPMDGWINKINFASFVFYIAAAVFWAGLIVHELVRIWI